MKMTELTRMYCTTDWAARMLNLQCIYIDVSSSLHTPGYWVEFD